MAHGNRDTGNDPVPQQSVSVDTVANQSQDPTALLAEYNSASHRPTGAVSEANDGIELANLTHDGTVADSGAQETQLSSPISPNTTRTNTQDLNVSVHTQPESDSAPLVNQSAQNGPVQ